MPFNPDILREALKVRSLSAADLSARLGLDADDFEAQIAREPEPGMGIVGDIAKELSLPKYVFFMSEAPELSGTLPDFRSDKPARSPKSRSTVEVIQFAEGVQRAAALLETPGAGKLPDMRAKTPDEIESFATEVRSSIGPTVEEQIAAKDSKAFYTVVRKHIEDAGVFVLHDSFPEEDGSGFCLYDARYPIILVNTKAQTRARRTFTLVHEFAHVLMRSSGISDPFVSRNATERICNRFAGSFLVPAKQVRALLRGMTLPTKPRLEDVSRAATRLKMSQQATVLRLEELGIFEKGSHSAWLATIKSLNINPDYKDKGGGGGKNGPPPQEKTKLAKYGFRFAATFGEQLAQGRINPINLYRSTGLKPAYQKAYFDYTKSLTATELQNLELEDE